MTMPKLKVDKNGAGLRLDRFLKKALPAMPMGHIFKLLRTRKVRVNGKRANREYKLSQGDEIILHMPEDRFNDDTHRPIRPATSMDFNIVFEDEHLLVVSKPPNLPVHPGAGHESNSLIDQVHAYLEVQDTPGSFRPALVHRLDKDTSGLVMLGKDAQAVRDLSLALKEGRITKKYLALCAGTPSPKKGTWELTVKRRDIPGSGGSYKPTRGRKDSLGVTSYRVAISRKLQVGSTKPRAVSLLVLKLHTGRTHQIRSHLEQVGHPLAGDRRYGDKDLNRLLRQHFGLRRQFLHAYRLNLTHPVTGKILSLSAAYAQDLLPLVKHLKLGVPAY